MIRVTLASLSLSRAALLRASGVPFDIAASGLDEGALKTVLSKSKESPRGVAKALADEKARMVSIRREGLVIGADQTLDLDGELLDKVDDLSGARRQLERLRGRAHILHAALAIAQDGDIIWRHLASPRVHMRSFSDPFLDDYLGCVGDVILGSVGCYHLEGPGVQLMERVEGDYFAVLGLPLIELLCALRQHGALPA